MAIIESHTITSGNFIVMAYRPDGEACGLWTYHDDIADARDEANERVMQPECAQAHIWGWNPDGDKGSEPEIFMKG